MTKQQWLTVFLVSSEMIFLSLNSTGQGTLGNGTFQDLDFERAVLVSYPSGQSTSTPGPVDTTEALPGWSVSIGGVPQASIPFMGPATLDQAFVEIFSPGLVGTYSIAIQGPASASFGEASLSQTGIIPTGAKTLQFVAGGWYGGSVGVGYTLNVNGQAIPIVPLGSGSTFGANISAFAGQSATISFNSIPLGANYLDNITFSSQAIPEPSAVSLIALGALGVARCVRRQGKSDSYGQREGSKSLHATQ